MPPAPAGRIVVAVVLGPGGSVGTDALGPYEVFARSPAFFVYTVSPGRAASVLSGGLALVPEHSLEDVDAGPVPEPDVVVVPAGVCHCNEAKSADLLIVGAYPDNTARRDLRRGNPAEHDEVVRNIAAVRLPPADPVSGGEGPLVRIWGG